MMTDSGRTEISAAPISKGVYVHDPALPRSARTDTKSVIVVTNRNRVRFEKLRIDDQYDYEMTVDAMEMLPPTWQHAGLPPDGTFAPKRKHDSHDPLQNSYSDYDGFMILAAAACNLVMRVLALSYHDRKPAEAKVRMEPVKPAPQGWEWVNFAPPTTNWTLRDELDEGRMAYVLDMLVRLFYRGNGETGERDWRKQELRKAVVLYVSGTGGASQFTNFTSLLMSLELAVGFAESEGVTANDASHKAVTLLIDAIRWRGIDPAKSSSCLVKSCRTILGDAMAGRVYECTKLNNRLKHYGRNTKEAKYFDDNVDKICETMRGLRVDAAYVILLGLIRLYGTRSPPARASKPHRISQFILGMIEDCVDRHGARRVDGDVEQKIRRLAGFVENDAIKSEKATYNDSRLVLGTIEALVKAARMLCAPDGLRGACAPVHELEDIVPDSVKPTKLGFVIAHDEELFNWLVFVAHSAVVWMDEQFHRTSVVLHVAQFGRASGIKCDTAIF